MVIWDIVLHISSFPVFCQLDTGDEEHNLKEFVLQSYLLNDLFGGPSPSGEYVHQIFWGRTQLTWSATTHLG